MLSGLLLYFSFVSAFAVASVVHLLAKLIQRQRSL